MRLRSDTASPPLRVVPLTTLLTQLSIVGTALAQSWLPPAPDGVEVTETHGIQFATVDSPGNEPVTTYWRTLPQYEDAFGLDRYGRPFGRVDTVFRMSRSEVTTAQWAEFLNVFAGTRERAWFELPENHDFYFFAYGPTTWGAYRERGEVGYRWRLYDIPEAERVPVNGILLRSAMMYCNWLHNGKTSDWGGLVTGAYDLAQFPRDGRPFASAIVRSPDARFWIPSADEWVKAAHFDPEKGGAGQPGYWEFPARSDEPVDYAPPSEHGDANAGFETYIDEFGSSREAVTLPLGSYPRSQSAYGLLDCIGSMEELTETLTPDFPTFNVIIEGSKAGYLAPFGTDASPLLADHLGYFLFGDYLLAAGLRVAARPVRVADFDDNGFVDFLDYLTFLDCLDGNCPSGRTADLNIDGQSDVSDYVEFVQHFEMGD